MTALPFDSARLDRLMDEAGIDVLLATSKHNVQYLLGGHRAIFFDYMDAMGLSRYLPILVYPKGKPDKAAYFGHRLENFQRDNHPFWTPVQQCNNSGSIDTMQKAVAHIRSAGIKTRGIGAELSFLPVDAGKTLQEAFPDAKLTDSLFVLERMRSIKTPEELKKLKVASEAVLDSMKERSAAPRSSVLFAIPVRSAMSPPMCGWMYWLAISEPKRRLRTSEGTLKRASPPSLAGLMMMTFPPRRRRSSRLRMRRGWLLAGLPPIRKKRSHDSTSSSVTVEVPVPMACVSPTPLAWWQ